MDIVKFLFQTFLNVSEFRNLIKNQTATLADSERRCLATGPEIHPEALTKRRNDNCLGTHGLWPEAVGRNRKEHAGPDFLYTFSSLFRAFSFLQA